MRFWLPLGLREAADVRASTRDVAATSQRFVAATLLLCLCKDKSAEFETVENSVSVAKIGVDAAENHVGKDLRQRDRFNFTVGDTKAAGRPVLRGSATSARRKETSGLLSGAVLLIVPNSTSQKTDVGIKKKGDGKKTC